jgi:hypothetical protein
MNNNSTGGFLSIEQVQVIVTNAQKQWEAEKASIEGHKNEILETMKRQSDELTETVISRVEKKVETLHAALDEKAVMITNDLKTTSEEEREKTMNEVRKQGSAVKNDVRQEGSAVKKRIESDLLKALNQRFEEIQGLIDAGTALLESVRTKGVTEMESILGCFQKWWSTVVGKIEGRSPSPSNVEVSKLRRSKRKRDQIMNTNTTTPAACDDDDHNEEEEEDSAKSEPPRTKRRVTNNNNNKGSFVTPPPPKKIAIVSEESKRNAAKTGSDKKKKMSESSASNESKEGSATKTDQKKPNTFRNEAKEQRSATTTNNSIEKRIEFSTNEASKLTVSKTKTGTTRKKAEPKKKTEPKKKSKTIAPKENLSQSIVSSSIGLRRRRKKPIVNEKKQSPSSESTSFVPLQSVVADQSSVTDEVSPMKMSQFTPNGAAKPVTGNSRNTRGSSSGVSSRKSTSGKDASFTKEPAKKRARTKTTINKPIWTTTTLVVRRKKDYAKPRPFHDLTQEDEFDFLG